MTHRSRTGFFAIALVAVLTTACASTVNHVLADPARYQNREVKLKGVVVNSLSVVGRGVYMIDDQTGKLWIVSSNGSGVPRNGARVTVKGTIRDGFDLGTLGGRINLPAAVGSGLVMMETSHKAR